MNRTDNTLKWCLRQGEKGGKHKGLRKIEKNPKESANQMQKAKSDLETMQYLYEGNKTDWVASTAFYAMYHALLSILFKLGYESRNQECTITAIEKFMQDGIINLEQEYIDMVRLLQESAEDAKSVREEMQYGSKTILEKARCEKLMNNAKKMVERIGEILEEIE